MDVFFSKPTSEEKWYTSDVQDTHNWDSVVKSSSQIDFDLFANSAA